MVVVVVVMVVGVLILMHLRMTSPKKANAN